MIVIMLKDKKTGFLDQEIGNCTIGNNEQFLVNVFATQEDDEVLVHLRVSCNQEMDDETFNAVYDQYDLSVYDEAAVTANEVEDCYDPTWEIVLPFSVDSQEMGAAIDDILRMHQNELLSVFEALSIDI